MAPPQFPGFGGDLLIGNFNDGLIDAYNPVTGAFLGALSDALGQPIANPGLWALAFRNTAAPNANTGTNANALFFTAGIDGEQDGLFARIDAAVPEPASFGLLAIVMAGLSKMLWRRSRT